MWQRDRDDQQSDHGPRTEVIQLQGYHIDGTSPAAVAQIHSDINGYSAMRFLQVG
jgi:hypothetical protein